MTFGDNWTLKDFYEELLAIMYAGMFNDVNEVLDVETRLLNGELTEEDKQKIINQRF